MKPLLPHPTANTAQAKGFGRLLEHPAAFGACVIAATLSIGMLWGMSAPLSGAVVAHGTVKTELNRKTVQHLEGGIIKRLLVRDGDTVRAGQALVELDNVSGDANLQLLRELLASDSLKLARLDAEQQLSPRFSLAPALLTRFGETLIRPAFEREQRIFQARRASLEQQLATLNDQLNAITSERHALQAQIRADQNSARLLEEELNMNRALENQKFVARARIVSIERTLADYQSKQGEHEASLAQNEQRANDVKLRIAALRNDFQRQAAEEYKEGSNHLAELQERLRPAEDAVERKQILAPVAGKVVGMRFHAPGQVAGPRDVLMEIVPESETLVIEAQVSVDGIRELYLGQAADLKFTAFKSRTTPVVTGKVSYISADALADHNGLPFYQVHIKPDPESLHNAGIRILQPGMSTEVFILTEGRSAFDYLLSPITDTLRKSMRER